MIRTMGLLMCIVCVTVSFASADILLVNGSFEEGTETTSYASGDSAITGWSHNGGGNVAMYHVNSSISNAYFPMATSDAGSYYGGVGAKYVKNAFVYLSRNVETLEIGQEYTIAGYVNNGNPAYGYWQVKIGGTVLGSGDLNSTWQRFSFTYTANETDGVNPTIYLGYVDNESAGGTQSSVLYDEVTIVPIPEPATMMMFASGLFGAAIRKKHAL